MKENPFSSLGIFVFRMSLVLYDFLVTLKAATLIFISGRGSAISSAKEGKSGFIYNLVRSYYNNNKLFGRRKCACIS